MTTFFKGTIKNLHPLYELFGNPKKEKKLLTVFSDYHFSSIFFLPFSICLSFLQIFIFFQALLQITLTNIPAANSSRQTDGWTLSLTTTRQNRPLITITTTRQKRQNALNVTELAN